MFIAHFLPQHVHFIKRLSAIVECHNIPQFHSILADCQASLENLSNTLAFMSPQQHNSYDQKKAMLCPTCTMLRNTHTSSSGEKQRSNSYYSCAQKTDKTLHTRISTQSCLVNMNMPQYGGNFQRLVGCQELLPHHYYSNPQSRLWTSIVGMNSSAHKHSSLACYERGLTNPGMRAVCLLCPTHHGPETKNYGQ